MRMYMIGWFLAEWFGALVVFLWQSGLMDGRGESPPPGVLRSRTK